MKATRKTIPTLIDKREEFSNDSGTLRAIKNPTAEQVSAFVARDSASQLNEYEKARLRVDANQNGIAYLVVSYDTPIAWETKKGHVYKVEQTFSQTTSKHQGLLYLFHRMQSDG